MRTILFAVLIILFCSVRLCGQDPLFAARQHYILHQEAMKQGNFMVAEHHLQKILHLQGTLPEYNQALVHNALGLVYYETSRFNLALRRYLLADSLCPGSEAGCPSLKISIHNNLGILYGWMGEYTLALNHYERAVHWLGLLPEHDEVYFNKLSMLQFNRGVLSYYQENYDDALVLLKESEKIKVSHNHPYLGSVYYNLARVYEAFGDTDSASGYYRKAISRWILEYHPDHYQLANIFLEFGELQRKSGNREEGFQLMLRALDNFLVNYGTRHPLTAGCYEKIARYYLDQSDIPKALEYIQQALVSVTRNFEGDGFAENPGHEDGLHDLTLLKILQSKVLVLMKYADQVDEIREKELLEKASQTNQLAIRILYRIQESYLTGESRTYLIARQKRVFELGMQVHIQLHAVTGDEAYLDSAYLDAAKGKANELLLEKRFKEWSYLESLPDTMVHGVTDLKLQADHLSHLIQQESQEIEPDSARLAEWRDQLYLLRDSFRSQMELIQGTGHWQTQFEYLSRNLSMDKIRSGLKRSESLVEFFMGDPESEKPTKIYAFVVTEDLTHEYQFPLDSSFGHSMEILMKNLHAFDPVGDSPENYRSLKSALHHLYENLFQPLESQLAGDRVIIIPDGLLSYIPFDALLTEDPPGPVMNYAGLPYLMLRYQISYANHTILTRRGGTPSLSFPEILAWAPAYDTPDASNTSPWIALEGASAEVREIMNVARGETLHKNLDKEEATSMLQTEKVIHLAMHAKASENQSGSPFFVLRPMPGEEQEERLYDFEIQHLSIHSPLVVLSGCETAGGFVQQGEGVINLSRSFLESGAASVVHALWPVEDTRAIQIMAEFYRGLKRGENKTESLRRAKLKYLAEVSPTYAHPYYWANFQVTGDPGPLRMKWWRWMGGLLLLSLLISYFLIRRRSFRRD